MFSQEACSTACGQNAGTSSEESADHRQHADAAHGGAVAPETAPGLTPERAGQFAGAHL